jgi:hypothetical protein
MKKLPEVEQAKELMSEAMNWSAFKWLLEKTRVRQTADAANAALDHLNRSIKDRWSGNATTVHKDLAAMPAAARQQQVTAASSRSNSELLLLIEKVVEADHAAHQARMHAEETFDQAENQMNASLAKEGCKKAIHSWELHEKAIRAAEAVEQANH